MSESGYLNFDLELERSAEGYDAEVLSSPAGETRIELDSAALQALDLTASPQVIGGQLFDAVFRGGVETCLRRSLDEAERQGKGLRLRLRLSDAPELANLPWEYLYDRSTNHFLALSRETPLVRYLDLPQSPRDLRGEPKLRVLVVIASPSGFPPLDTEREWDNLRSALHELEEQGGVALERLNPPSVGALQAQLLRQEYHILHFLGHGGFDQASSEGILLLQDETGNPQAITGQYFSALLRDQRSLRLALLNACQGAEAAAGDAYSGVAQQLVRGGIPAVIAMRTAISDAAGASLARQFYAALAEGAAVDAALAEARKTLFAQGAEWGTPVLFMRSPSGELWPRQAKSEPVRSRKTALAIGAAAALILAIAALVYGLIGPTRMDPRSTMNVAVAEIGALTTEAVMQPSSDGQLIGTWIADALAAANGQVAAGDRVLVWHDGLPRTQKRARLGTIAGASPEERAAAAEALAARVGADVVIYGHLASRGTDQELELEFYVSARLRPESNETLGRYQLGDPIAAPKNLPAADTLAKEAVAGEVALRTQAIFRLILALREDLLGRHDAALAALRQTETDLPAWQTRSQGKEILYGLMAREALFLKHYDEAETYASRALDVNPDYPRAFMILGGVGVRRAQEMPPAESLAPGGPLDRADAAYRQAVALATASTDRKMELITRLGQAAGHIQRGTASYLLDAPESDPEANRWFEQVIVETRPLLAALEEIRQYRMLAQANSYLGVAYWQLSNLALRSGDTARSQEMLIQAQQTLEACKAQAVRLPEDKTLTEMIIGGTCTPALQEVRKTLGQ